MQAGTVSARGIAGSAAGRAAGPGSAVAREEWGWAWLCAAAVMAVTCAPYVSVWAATPPGHAWHGFLHNVKDQAVYLAWMRQAYDGSLTFANPFTAEPQVGLYLHLYTWALGALARATGVPLAVAYHVGRVAGGVAALLLVYRLAACLSPDRGRRRTMLLTVAVSAGLGWVFMPTAHHLVSADTWQAEAVTFASLYSNGLFAASLALMLAVVAGLHLAEATGRLRYAVGAGLAGLVLANVHTYDVITLAAIWSAYLAARWLRDRRAPAAAIRHAAVAALITAPGVAWMLYFYATETVFRLRAHVPTLSPPPFAYLLGYGLLWLFAAAGVREWKRQARDGAGTDAGTDGVARAGADFFLLLATWIVVGLVLIYLPVAFQRKLVQGLHVPISMLAGLGLAGTVDRLRPAARAAPWSRTLLVAISLAALGLTNALFVIRDLAFARHSNDSYDHVPIYWPAEDFQAMQWMSENLPRDATVFSMPPAAVLVPALAGRTTYAGHPSETPRYAAKVQAVIDRLHEEGSGSGGAAYLAELGVTHVFEAARPSQFAPEGFRLSGVHGLRRVYGLGGAGVYDVPGQRRAASGAPVTGER